MPLRQRDVDVAASRIGLPLSSTSSTAKQRGLCFCNSRREGIENLGAPVPAQPPTSAVLCAPPDGGIDIGLVPG